MTVQELRNERMGLITQMKALNDTSLKEKRDFTAEEKTKYEAIEKDVERIGGQIDRIEAIAKAEQHNASDRTPGVRAALDQPKTAKGFGGNDTAEYSQNFRAYMQGGEKHTPISITASLTKGTGAQVGYLAPTEYETEIRKKVYPLNVMRRLATVTTSSSDSVIPVEGSLPTFSWIGELGTYGTTDLTVARGTFSAYKLGGIILASEEILADAFVDLPAYIADRSRVAIAAAEEAAYVIGDGNNKPTGIVTSAPVGLTTAAPTAFTMDEVLDFMDSLPVGYQANAQILTTIGWRSRLRKLKDSTGQYLWQPSVQQGVPDLFNGKVVNVSAYVPAVAASAVVAVYGDISQYEIVDRVGFYVRQLNELYAVTGQVGFQIAERTDGKLINTAAVTAMQMHA